jgi:ATP/maltotriose-dependent transcriptional regulator MalT/DNA-binding SARP family transcriptional activator
MDRTSGSWKISRPTIADVLPRERLFEKLDQARSSPAIWIAGPAGSGKTTLVSSYVDSRKLPCIWYEIDETDRDIASFFYRLRLAAEEAMPGKELSLPELAHEQIAFLLPFTSNFFFNLTASLPSPFLLVFDDYQNVVDETVLRQVLIQAVGKISPGINILIISRKEPPAPFSRLIARRELTTFGWRDIKFDREEFKQVLKTHVNGKISNKTISDLHLKLEGWVSGLLLLSEYLKQENVDPETVVNSMPREYFDYFAKEILENLEPEIRDLLLKTSFLEAFSPDMADMFTGVNRAERILEYLHSHNLFVEQINHSPPLFRYHQLFRGFLNDQARRSFSQKEMKKITQKAAMILLESEFIEESVDLLRESEEWTTLTEIIAKMSPALIDQGRHHTLNKWFDYIPAEMLEKDPDLLYWKGRNLMPIDPAESRVAYKRAMELYRTADNGDGVYKSWSGQISTFVLLQVDLESLDELIELFGELQQKFPTPEDIVSQARIAASMFFALVFRWPTHPEIESWRDRALDLTEKSGSVNLHIWALFTWSLMARFRGDLMGLRSAMEAIRTAVQKPGVRYFNRIMSNAFGAIDYFYRYDHDACLKEVEKGLKLAEESGVHGWDRLLIAQRINVFLSEGDLEASRANLEEMEGHLDAASPHDRSYYHARYGWYALLTGDYSLALHNAQIGMKFSEGIGLPENFAQHQLLQGHVALEMDRIDLAESSIRNAMQLGQEMGNNLVIFLCLLLQARLAYHREDNSSGDHHLKSAFKIGSEQGYVNWHFFQPDVISDLCSRALQADIEVKYVQGLIQKRGLVPPREAGGLMEWPWPVKIYTLGRFELVLDNNPISIGAKGQQKPLDLLKAIICFGGQNVSEEQLVDALWPDASGDHAHQNFTITLHRLRKLLGVEDAIQLNSRQVTMNPNLCWVDCWATEELLRDLDSQLKKDPPEEAARSAMTEVGRIWDLYKGHFLEQDIQISWKISMQERIRSKYLQAMDKVGQCWENLEMWSEAVGLYKNVLEVDDLAENIYRKLMVCYQRLGYKAEALAVCHRCIDTLSGTLGVEISPETQNLCDEIRKS